MVPTPIRSLALSISAALAFLTVSAASAQTILVKPYVQPGDGRTLEGKDVKVIRWFTDATLGAFTVEYCLADGKPIAVKPTSIALNYAEYKAPKRTPKKETPDEPKKEEKESEQEKKDEPKVPVLAEKEQHYIKYTAILENLPFDSDVTYSVKLDDKLVRTATFCTRASRKKPIRCVLVGDMAQGRDYQKAIAFGISKRNPEFLVALGDIVYPSGRMLQYMGYFFGTYNDVSEASLQSGAPLMASVPFYPLLGNHDIAAKLPAVPDALAAYQIFSVPNGGPGDGPWITPLGQDMAVAKKFRAAAEDSYPRLDVYSFDYGPAHIVVLNVNPKIEIDNPAFKKWLVADLKASDARWKMVCFHMPAFHSSVTHYREQQARPLSPIFEECGVDLTFAGHVHNYQRSVPLKFAPDAQRGRRGEVNGKFTLDTEFDGVKNTKPNGIIHIVAGGGGASLYGPAIEKTVPTIKRLYGENYADFTAKMVVDQHSFVELDITQETLKLKSFGVKGDEIDSITVSKPK